MTSPVNGGVDGLLQGGVELACDHVELTCDHMELTCDHVELACDHVELACDHVELACDHVELTCDHVEWTEAGVLGKEHRQTDRQTDRPLPYLDAVG